MARRRPGDQVFPPVCCECGYDLSGADASRKPVVCPECAAKNPIVEIEGENYNYRRWGGPTAAHEHAVRRIADRLKAALLLDFESWGSFGCGVAIVAFCVLCAAIVAVAVLPAFL